MPLLPYERGGKGPAPGAAAAAAPRRGAAGLAFLQLDSHVSSCIVGRTSSAAEKQPPPEPACL